MSKQRIIDILGDIVFLGMALCLIITANYPPLNIIGICGMIVLFVICCIRVYLFRTIPKKERRIYEEMDMFFGPDRLIHPYTQTIGVFYILVVRIGIFFANGL
jgi:putative effector of murein hydrolase LrgA (UPF0299 family)